MIEYVDKYPVVHDRGVRRKLSCQPGTDPAAGVPRLRQAGFLLLPRSEWPASVELPAGDPAADVGEGTGAAAAAVAAAVRALGRDRAGVAGDGLSAAVEAALAADPGLLAYRCTCFDDVVTALAGGGPVAMTLMVGTEFGRPDAAGVAQSSRLTVGGHALTAVGLVHHDGETHVLARNCWGPGWGKDGCCLLSERHFRNLIDAYALTTNAPVVAAAAEKPAAPAATERVVPAAPVVAAAAEKPAGPKFVDLLQQQLARIRSFAPAPPPAAPADNPQQRRPEAPQPSAAKRRRKP